MFASRRFLAALLVVALAIADAQTTTSSKKPTTTKKKPGTSKKKSTGKKTVSKKSASKKPTGKSTGKRRPRTPIKPLPPPEPIKVPIENVEALAPFHAALATLREFHQGVVRILHFGDSHVAADIYTAAMREQFQNAFGNAGSGLVMPGPIFRGYRRVGVSVRAPAKYWHGATLRVGDPGLVGLAGAALVGKERSANAPASAVSAATVTGTFANFELQAVSDTPGQAPCVDLSIDDAVADVEREKITGAYGELAIQKNRAPLPLESHTLSVESCGGESRIVGLDLLSGLPGVIYDSFGINGAQFADQDKIPSALRRDLIARLNPTLIIVSFGTNEIGRKGITAEDYKAECLRLLRALRTDAGSVPVLVTGPPDRPGRTTKSRAMFEERSGVVIAVQQAAAKEAGCAFWDARAAMGGFGAMLRWRKSLYAQPDLVHLTQPGYHLLARMLFEELATPPTP